MKMPRPERTRVKICGITRPQDAVLAAQYGADAIGLVFYDKSPRSVEIDQAQLIVKALPAFVTVVALFVNADAAYIEKVLAAVNIDLMQFHGDETATDCERYGRRYIKAVRMHENMDLQQQCKDYASASALLVDSYHPDVAGGTGAVFDWDRIPPGLDLPLILAGGLQAENISQAIETVKPYAVDVSSGVELEKGLKGEALIAAFMRGVI